MPGTDDQGALLPRNKTLKLEADLEERVRKAMSVRGNKVFNDFGRAALLAYCRVVEQELKQQHPEEYERIYGSHGNPVVKRESGG